MKIIDDAKDFFGKKVLERNINRNTRNVKVCNINDAKKIGIVYYANKLVSYEIIIKLIKDFNKKNIEVNALGYADNNKLIDHYLYRKGFDFITKNQLNWYGKPSGEGVSDFIQKPFDILINLSLVKTYPLDYIVALSKSKFKVGRFFEESNFLDLMIDIEKENKTLSDLGEDIKNDPKSAGKKHIEEIEAEVKPKIEIEIQLNFLINQILHYLSELKCN